MSGMKTITYQLVFWLALLHAPIAHAQTIDTEQQLRTFAACAVATDGRVGVDVEAVTPGFDYDSLLYRVATAPERDMLANLDEHAARRCFYRLWVLKEALGKALGEGVGLPFDHIHLGPRPDGSLACDLSALGQVGTGWQFNEFDLGNNAVMAVALRTSSPVTLTWRRGEQLVRSVGSSQLT